MTGEDHDTDAVIAALTSPALPSEQVGEDAAVAAMLGALSAVPARPTGLRSRRGVAIAAVTVASLGVGGLVAAGPGNFFSPAADRPPATGPTSTAGGNTIDPSDQDEPAADEPAGPVTETTVAHLGGAEVQRGRTALDSEADECEADRHGTAVSDEARSTEPDRDVREVATSDCGKPDEAGGPGDTPASTAPGRTGDTPASTAPGQTGDTPASTAPGQSETKPSDTVPTPPTATPPAPQVTAPQVTAPPQQGGNGRP